MRRILLATVGFLACAAGAAVAADLPRAMPAKAPAYVPIAAYNWTGFYLGINGGLGWGHSLGGSGGRSTGGLLGGTAGYNWQAGGSPWVFGLEGDIDYSNFQLPSNTCVAGCRTRNSWLSTVRGRVGYSYGRVLPYVTGGLAIGDIDAQRFGFADQHQTSLGWAAGAGVEAALVGNWTAKVEYLHYDLGTANCSGVLCPSATRVGFNADTIRGGFNYRF